MSKIPVFIVVTKYDRIIDDLKEDAVDSGKDVDKSIEKKAYEIFKKLTLDPLHSLAREAREEHGMDVEICTVGFRKRGREFLPTHFTPPGLKHWGSAQLVSLMRKKLSPELRPLLAAVQVTDPRNKLEGKSKPHPNLPSFSETLITNRNTSQRPSTPAQSSTGAPSSSNQSPYSPS